MTWRSPARASSATESMSEAAGITSICGLGPSGGDYHTNREYVELSSIPRRAKLLAALLCEQ